VTTPDPDEAARASEALVDALRGAAELARAGEASHTRTCSVSPTTSSTSCLTDEDAAVRQLYEEASERARRQGAAMAQDEAIMALCEKSLVAFLRDFLSKQPGVRHVPAITVAHKGSPG